MSGGSMDYLCFKVEEAAHDLQRSDDPLRQAFGHHLALVAEALHDIEWTDSADRSRGSEHAAIAAALQLDVAVLGDIAARFRAAADALSGPS